MIRNKRLKNIHHLRIAFVVFLWLPFFGTNRLWAQSKLSEQDSLIRNTWLAFADAVNHDDLQGFRALSADCIYCPWCIQNTPSEDSLYKRLLSSLGRKGFEHSYPAYNVVQSETFLKQDYRLIFTKTVKLRMRKPSNVLFTPITYFPILLEQDCAVGAASAPHAELIEFLLVDTDSNPQGKGPSLAFAFVKKGNTYKFCAFTVGPQ